MVKRLYLLMGGLLLVFVLGSSGPSKKVLCVFSYHPEYSWVAEETRGVEEVFEGEAISVEKFYMDTKRRTDPEWKEKVASDAMKRIEESKPDLVMVFDDNACEFVARPYAGKDLPFVFCGMNREPEQYGFPAPNITGVVEREFFEQSVALLKQLAPHVKRIGILSDDSPTSQGPASRIREGTLPVEVSEVYATNDFGAWKSKVKEFQTSVDAIGLFGYHTLKEGRGGQHVPSVDVLKWTLKSSHLPEFAILDFTVRDGALCGIAQSGYNQGKTAAGLAIKILSGVSPSDIPIETPRKGLPILNQARAEKLHITIPRQVTEEAEIVK
jgi:ABC-type uncharacterized transport system substrate-binding protein